LHHQHASDKLICDEIHAAADEVTIICLGPLTNLARVLRRDPEVASLVSQIVITGGSVGVGGNVTPAAEFNIYCDPVSAQTVFRSPITKTVIPLDVTRQVSLTLDVMDELPAGSTKAGSLLRKMLPFAFRAHHQVRGEESILINGVVALLNVLQPELFVSEEIAGDVETSGNIAEGATVFDRRVKPLWRNNMEVAMTVDATAAKDCIVRGLRRCGSGG
jgi:purine nucleosidase